MYMYRVSDNKSTKGREVSTKDRYMYRVGYNKSTKGRYMYRVGDNRLTKR